MPESRIKVLFLPKWYPNRCDPMPGLFVQRQAEAVSAHCEVAVLYVQEDPNCSNRFELDVATEKGVHVVRVYFRSPATRFPVIPSILKLFRFFKANRMGFRILKNFSADLIHVHILTRLGVIALLNKSLNKTPYLVTEHWSRYFPQNATYTGFLRKIMTRMVVRSASCMVTVSVRLRDAMIAERLRNPNFKVIPNPVDMELFRIMPSLKQPEGERKRIIHISCFEDRSKNISGFLRVIHQLKDQRDDFSCHLVGEGPDWQLIKNYSQELGLLDSVVSFTGLLEQEKLAEEINRADMLVLSSNYETFASVIIESFACGVPVVSTNVGIADSVIKPWNGIIIPPGNEKALADAIAEMLDHCRSMDPHKIREGVVSCFDNRIIAKELYNVYREVLRRN